MIKRLLTIYLPAAAVLTTVTLAAVFLYNDVDPELNDVEFVIAEDAETENTDRIAVGAIHELPQQSDREQNDEIRELPQQIDVSPNRNDIRTTTIEQTEPVIVTASGPGVSIRCEVNSGEIKTAHQAMKQAADQCNFVYVTKNYSSLGVFVDGIAGLSSNKTAGLYWIFSVNGTKANVGVSSYQIKPGDTITWNYEQEY